MDAEARSYAVSVIDGPLQLGDNYFDARYTRCAVYDGRGTGIIVGFPISAKPEIDPNSGKGFARTMGFFRFLRRMPLFVRMEKMMPSVEDESGYHIHTISVAADCRGRGIGSEIIARVGTEHGARYLHVNRDNEAEKSSRQFPVRAVFAVDASMAGAARNW